MVCIQISGKSRSRLPPGAELPGSLTKGAVPCGEASHSALLNPRRNGGGRPIPEKMTHTDLNGVWSKVSEKGPVQVSARTSPGLRSHPRIENPVSAAFRRLPCPEPGIFEVPVEGESLAQPARVSDLIHRVSKLIHGTRTVIHLALYTGFRPGGNTLSTRRPAQTTVTPHRTLWDRWTSDGRSMEGRWKVPEQHPNNTRTTPDHVPFTPRARGQLERGWHVKQLSEKTDHTLLQGPSPRCAELPAAPLLYPTLRSGHASRIGRGGKLPPRDDHH